MKIQLRNDFHNTSASLIVGELKLQWDGVYICTISENQMRRAGKKLCGMSDCCCGTIRGPQEFSGKKLIVEVSANGGAR